MKNKLSFLTKISLQRKIKTKWFIGANILLALVVVAALNLDNVINFFGGDFDSKTTVYVSDNTNYTYDLLKKQIEETSKTYNDDDSSYIVKKYDGKDIKKDVKKNKNTIAFIIDESQQTVIDVTLISKDYLDTIEYQLLSNAVNNTKTQVAISKSNIDLNELNKITGSIEIKREYLEAEKSSDDENMSMIMSTVFPLIILPFFMLTIFLVQMIGAEVNDEKSTRSMEIIISNVSPKVHFVSKIIAGNLFVIIQGLLFVVYAFLGYGVRLLMGGKANNGLIATIGEVASDVMGSNFMDKLIYIIPITLILMLLTFLAYSLVAGILASVTTNTEDFQQVQTPIMIVLVAGYYFAMMAATFKGALFIRVMSYIPLISAILCPSLLVLGQISIVDVIISIIIMVITNYLLIKYGMRIYKQGILNYSSSNLFKKIFKSLKN